MGRSPALSALAALLMTACATAAAVRPDASALRGCWIERKGDAGEFVTTQRWSARGDVWQGVQLFYAPGVAPDPATGWELRPEGDGYRLCQIEFAMASGPPCFRAFFGPGRVIDDETEWAELDVDPEHLRIAYVTSGQRVILFDGRRDGCD